MELIDRLEAAARGEAALTPELAMEAAGELLRLDGQLTEERQRTEELRRQQAEAVARQVDRIRAAMEDAQLTAMEALRRLAQEGQKEAER